MCRERRRCVGEGREVCRERRCVGEEREVSADYLAYTLPFFSFLSIECSYSVF